MKFKRIGDRKLFHSSFFELFIFDYVFGLYTGSTGAVIGNSFIFIIKALSTITTGSEWLCCLTLITEIQTALRPLS